MTAKKTENKKSTLMRKFAAMFIIFTAATLLLNTQVTYFNQKKAYEEQCKENLRNATDYIDKLLLDDGDEFKELAAYFEDHVNDLRIDYKFNGNCYPELEAFERLFKTNYPDKSFGVDITFSELNDECKLAYANYKYEYWLHRFEQSVQSFGLQYAYFIYPTEGEKVRYMIDGIREKATLDGKVCISLGAEAEQPRSKYESMWATWDKGSTVNSFDVVDNEFGNVYTYYYPLVIKGEKVGLICADINVDYVKAAIGTKVIDHLFMTVLVLGVCSAVMLVIIRKTVLKRISNLEAHVKEYSENKQPELAEKIISDGLSNDEIGSLSLEFANMITELEHYMKNLQAVTAEKERIGAELNVATNIQASMLPCIFPAFPERSEFDIYASMDPAKEVGGDFYDFFMADEDHLAIVIADVSGKGVPAALFMVIAKTLIKNNAQLGKPVEEVLTSTNDQLDEENGAEMFVTVWMGIYNIHTGELCFSEAGHEHPLLTHSDGKVEIIKPVKKKLPLATLGGIKYLPNKIYLKEGDCLFLYTDGVPEANNKDNKMYGMERLEEFITKNYDLDPDELLKAVRADVDNFAGDAPQFDDLTMLALRIKKLDKTEESSDNAESADNTEKTDK